MRVVACVGASCRHITSATHGTDTELLSLLTTRAGTLLAEVKAALAHRVRGDQPPLSDDQLDVIIDIVVRTVLSHIMQPSGTPEAAAGIAWLAARTLDTPSTPSLRHDR